MDIQDLELLCKQLYESQDTIARANAEKTLVAFQNSTDALAQCQSLLERGNSSYSQLLAATTLTKLVTRPGLLDLQERVDIRNYVLNYLATRPNLPNFVVQALVVLFAKLTKTSWFDQWKGETVFSNLVEDVKKFLQSSVEHCSIGVQILSQVTVEINQMTESEAHSSFTKHRKVACSFRDTKLYDIFLLAVNLLSTARNNKALDFRVEPQQGLMSQILKLTRNCLSFDFIGTSSDDSTDETHTVQIPTSWRPAFLEKDILSLFFDLYHFLPPSLSHLSISCLVQMISVRRSLFSNNERARFLSTTVKGIKTILENPQGLTDPDNYHEFCRVLAKLKSNYQLSELVVVEGYAETMDLIAKFTIESLQMWHFAPNSVHFLLALWQRMVSSVPYVKVTDPHLLDTYTPEVTKAYITSRLASVSDVIREGMEDPLDDVGMVHQQLEQISVIERCDYEKTCTMLVQLFDQNALEYEKILSTQAMGNNVEIKILEGKLTWLVYFIGSAIGGRVSFTACEEHDIMDGELVLRVLQLMNLTDRQLSQGAGCQRLELAIMCFLEHVRKIYISEQMQKVKVYKRLSEVLGLRDEGMLLSVITRKIITNLKYLGQSERLIRKTLSLLNDLTESYSCVRKLVKLDEIQYILNNHSSEYFSFLGTDIELSAMRCRSMFYMSLGNLLLVDLGDDEQRFVTFLLPLQNAFEELGNMLADPNVYGNIIAKKALIGLARDLRGLVHSFNTKISYRMFFEWMYPDYTPILLRAIEIWTDDPHVTTAVLKLYAELVQNRSQRLLFDVSSPYGILLFRETAKAISCYGNRILTFDISKEQQYPMRLKGISVCFVMLKAALCGSYVNFGVFKLYGDDALDNVLNVTANLILSIKREDLLAYPKLSQSYYMLMECLAQDHISFLTTLQPRAFLYILESISEGLTALDTTVCTGCCSTLDNIVTYIFKELAQRANTFPGKKLTRHPSPENDILVKSSQLHPEIFQGILQTLLNISLFEDCRNHYSLSRPLLVLILLYEDYFNTLKDNIVRSQPLDKQQSFAQKFDTLMEGIERNIVPKNRDRFTQNLGFFRRENTSNQSKSNTLLQSVNAGEMIVS